MLEQREYGRDVLKCSFEVSLKLRVLLPSYLPKKNQNMSAQLCDVHTTLYSWSIQETNQVSISSQMESEIEQATKNE